MPRTSAALSDRRLDFITLREACKRSGIPDDPEDFYKMVFADGEWLFLSSANLTQQAFTINMELGVLVRGGTMPERVEKQFERLIHIAVLERVE